jgi:hypothetical protein
MSSKKLRILLLCLSLLCCFTLSVSFPAHVSAASAMPANHTTSTVVKPAINRVDCDGRTDFVEIWSGQYLDCFANSGTVNVNIVHVFQVCAGNNLVYFLFTDYETLGVPDWTCDPIPYSLMGVTSTTIVQIQILF